jgi:gamma-glutamylcyclotransferase (GGCT)/AIG2-like uncharacterized protein YtfP
MRHRLFSYGTLQAPEVILSVIGRRPDGRPARLPGWAVFRMRDAGYPGIVPGREEDDAPGLIYDGMSDGELLTLDRFEGPQYERREMEVGVSGGEMATAWVYVVKTSRRDEVTGDPWRLEEFLQSGLPEFMERFVRERRREYREE